MKTNAGPLAESPVIASMCFSSTVTTRPTVSKSFRAVSICSGRTAAPAAIAVMAQPTCAGVLGMARTTATPAGSRCCKKEIGTEAAIEITSASGAMASETSSSTCATACGFTQIRISSAPATADRLSLPTGMPSWEESSSQRAIC